MNPWMRIAAAIAVVAIATYAGLTLLGPRLGPSAQATPTPSPAATPPCGHELVQGLVLTAGCTYRTSGMQPTLSILGDGTWLDRFQTPSALDFIAFTGPAQDTTVMVRPLRTVLSDPCSIGSGARRSTTPATARDYLAGLAASSPSRQSAAQTEALGLQGWRFDLGADVKQTFDPGDPCAFVSLSEPSADAPVESTETVAVQRSRAASRLRARRQRRRPAGDALADRRRGLHGRRRSVPRRHPGRALRSVRERLRAALASSRGLARRRPRAGATSTGSGRPRGRARPSVSLSGWNVSTITASSSVASLPIDASTVPGCGPCGIPAGWSVNEAIPTPRRLMKLPAT